MKIRIAFYKGKGNWKNKIIRWWTGSPYSHVELIMPDNYTWISISPLLSSTVSSRIKTDFDLEKWDFVQFDITQDQHNILLEFFEDTKDCSYDWIGMIFSQLLPFNIKRKKTNVWLKNINFKCLDSGIYIFSQVFLKQNRSFLIL